jgi:hypothetical protein
MAKDKMTIEVEAVIEPLVELTDAQKVAARKERALKIEEKKAELQAKLSKDFAKLDEDEKLLRANGA